jgi:alpha-1,6-mannosyltransferase
MRAASALIGVLRARATSASLQLRHRSEPARRLATRLVRATSAGAPYDEARDRVRSRLWRTGILGFIGSVLITLGASQANSPFTYKAAAGAWFFGIPTPVTTKGLPTPQPGPGLFLGVVAVYGGMLLLIRAWYDVVRLTSRHRGVPLSRLAPLFVAWMIPLLVVAPLFSRDLYSYIAQGEMMSHHINPYQLGTGDLGTAPILNYADRLWWHVTSPYGPAFLVAAGWIVELARHDPLASLVGMRLLAVAGTVMFAWAIPIIARSFGRDGGVAFTLAALNPLILLHLVGGGHNDALMVGLLALGYAAARRGHPVVGIVACSLGAVVKVPAIVGVIYIGWEWLGEGRTTRERLRPLVSAGLIAVATMGAVSTAAGLGWGWISGLSNPDTIRSWLDPATAVGLLGAKTLSFIGLGDHSHLLLTLTRGSAMLLAIGISLRLLVRSDRVGPLAAIGWTLVAFAVLGPVVQPWYLTWGFVFLAPVAEGGARKVLCIASAASCFLGLPGGFVLVHELSVANPVLVVIACIALVVLLAALVLPRLRRAEPAAVEPAAGAEGPSAVAGRALTEV